MILNHSETEAFVNNITSAHTDIPMKVVVDDGVIMPKYDNNSVSVSDYSMVMMLLESCSIRNRKLFDKILYFYYWAIKSFILGNLSNSEWCIIALEREIYKKFKRLKGIGNKVQHNLYFNFIFGHEAIHHCFANNESYKKEVMSEIVGLINEAYGDAFTNKKWLQEIISRPLRVINQERSRIDAVEECACDRESLKYIHKTYIERANLDELDYSSLLNQLLLMFSMIHYERIMNNISEHRLRITDLKKGSVRLNRYQNTLIEYEVFRLVCATFTIIELSLIPSYNPMDTVNLIVKENRKRFFRLICLGILNLAYSVNGSTSTIIDEKLRSDLHKKIRDINSHLFEILLQD